jgi:pyruvate, water dikinase
MLNSSAGVSGVMFTLDTETGSPDVVHVDAIWSIGENIVRGLVVLNAVKGISHVGRT